VSIYEIRMGCMWSSGSAEDPVVKETESNCLLGLEWRWGKASASVTNEKKMPSMFLVMLQI